jgi:hypothetical protein
VVHLTALRVYKAVPFSIRHDDEIGLFDHQAPDRHVAPMVAFRECPWHIGVVEQDKDDGHRAKTLQVRPEATAHGGRERE